MKRTPFARKTAPPVRLRDREPGPIVRAERVGTYAHTETVVHRPKAEKAKPGKRQPNAQERRWMASIVAYGCIACRLDGLGYVAPEVHHILRGGVRMGHMHTLPLCPGHHRDGAGRAGLVARHPFKAQFEARYGTESALLDRMQYETGIAP